MDIQVINNEQQQQYQAEVDGERAYLEYRWYKGTLALMHTFVPPVLEGRGIASALAREALEFARREHKKIMVYCPYVALYLKRHPEYQDLVDPKYHQR